MVTTNHSIQMFMPSKNIAGLPTLLIILQPLIICFVLALRFQRRRTLSILGHHKLGVGYNPIEQQAAACEEDVQGSGGSQPHVLSIWTFPVKSCRGVQLDSAVVNKNGLAWDRRFMFVVSNDGSSHDINQKNEDVERKASWHALTLRECPSLALVETELWLPDTQVESEDQGYLVIRWRALPRLLGRVMDLVLGGTRSQHVVLSLARDERAATRVQIHKDSAPAEIFKEEIPVELKNFLGVTKPGFALARQAASVVRPIYRNAPRSDIAGYQPEVEFQDSYPLHILSLSSVLAVEAKLPEHMKPLTFVRFRANFLLTHVPEFAEDSWKLITIGTFTFFVTSRTTRCRLPNVDPFTGKKDMYEPDKTMKSFRCIDEGAGKTACLGMCMVAKDLGCIIRAGDHVGVVEVGDHYYEKPTGVRAE